MESSAIGNTAVIRIGSLSDASSYEFSTSMKDLCHDVFGVVNKKKDPKGTEKTLEQKEVMVVRLKVY
ncbi:hypothetical protein L1887_07855 [Cichorium endivia]|nr:hypothetical protein L1887_07855 [Cichorium endivia]